MVIAILISPCSKCVMKLTLLTLHTGQEQLNKSREIIRRLQEEKRSIQEEMERRLESSERSIEEDKEEMIQELRRGRTAALQLMQVKGHPCTGWTMSYYTKNRSQRTMVYL